MSRQRPSYMKSVLDSLKTMVKGFRVSGRHYVQGYKRDAPLGIADPDYFKKDQGPITIQYPMQKVPVPETGRYRLYMETDDCIGCDKCARICPVDCITIETFRADGDLGKTSDGTVKRLHLPVFDIDMAKCMYCGLCTTVCPTDCLYMTPVYDYSEYDRDNFVYHFGAYSPEDEARIRQETEASLAAKKAAKTTPSAESAAQPAEKRRPMVQRSPATEAPVSAEENASEETSDVPAEDAPKPRPHPMLRPIMKTAPESEGNTSESPATDQPTTEEVTNFAPSKLRPRPLMKPAQNPEAEQSEPKPEAEATNTVPPKVRPRPIMKPAKNPEAEQAEPTPEAEVSNTAPPKVRPRPIMKPAESPEAEQSEPKPEAEITKTAPPKVRPRPIMKPAESPESPDNAASQESPELENPVTPPASDRPKRPRPIMKPQEPMVEANESEVPAPESIETPTSEGELSIEPQSEAPPATEKPKRPRPIMRPTTPPEGGEA